MCFLGREADQCRTIVPIINPAKPVSAVKELRLAFFTLAAGNQKLGKTNFEIGNRELFLYLMLSVICL